MDNPTSEYTALSGAFSFLNRKLFEDRLPLVLLTLSRRGGSLGYYRNRAFISRIERDRTTDEIALCANTFRGQTDKEILSTLVHEMVHLWQFSFGKRTPRRGYHNLEWAQRMLAAGLHPSDTGEPGGKMYGYGMSDYVIEGGPFDRAADDLVRAGWRLGWEEGSSRESATELQYESKQTRRKFVCASCQLAAWAKFSARLVCGNCGLTMV